MNLRAERWGTGGPVDCQSHEVPGRFVFPIQLGVGEALAVADWKGEVVVVPLSSLEGWLEVELRVEEGVVDVPPFEADTASWSAGSFVLHGHEGVEGRLEMASLEIELFSARLLTDGLVSYATEERGADLALQVEVEPSLGDPAMLLLNLPTGQLALPGGPHPWTATLEPGVVEDPGQRRAAAIAAADAAEAEQMKAVLAALMAELSPPCLLSDDWTPYFEGYALTLEERDGACVIAVEPDPVQHRRRFRYSSEVPPARMAP